MTTAIRGLRGTDFKLVIFRISFNRSDFDGGVLIHPLGSDKNRDEEVSSYLKSSLRLTPLARAMSMVRTSFTSSLSGLIATSPGAFFLPKVGFEMVSNISLV